MRTVCLPLLALLAATLLVLALTACGSSENGVASKSAADVLAAARAAANSASSVQVISKASIARAKSTLNASYARSQARVQSSLFNINYEVIRDGNTLYVKGNKVFDKRLEERLGVKIPPNTWLKGSTKTGHLAQIGPETEAAQELPIILAGSGQLTKEQTTKIDGQPAIALRQARKLSTATLYVATTGKPYPLRLSKTGTESGQTTFTNWNTPIHIDPPTNAIELSQLQTAG
jgi:uncharacterized protein YcfL